MADNYVNNVLVEMYVGLMDIILAARYDMHEPDEQNIKARVIGDVLDNATGNSIRADAVRGGYQELILCIDRYSASGHRSIDCNIATLLAVIKNMANFVSDVYDDEWIKCNGVIIKRFGPLHVVMIRKVPVVSFDNSEKWCVFIDGNVIDLESAIDDEVGAKAEADQLISDALMLKKQKLEEAVSAFCKH